MSISILYLSFFYDNFKGRFQRLIVFFHHFYYLKSLVLSGTPGWDLSFPLLFAAEDEGRTEEPTERKRQKEREKGRVPKSADIPSALVTVGALAVLFFTGNWMFTGLMKMTKFFIGQVSDVRTLGSAELIQISIMLIKETGMYMAPLFITAMIMAIAGNMAQVGFLFTLKPLQPDFSRISLTLNNVMKKVFFSKQIAVNLIKTILKIFFLSWIGYYIITVDFLNLMRLSSLGVADSLRVLSHVGFKLGMIMALVLFVMALPDYMYQKYEFTESIKMTKEELRQETKESEGDPLVKQRRRQRAMEMYRKNMLRDIQKADVIITNPVHFAVALRYDPDQEHAPRVLAKGEDNMALMIKNIARRNEIPVIENKPLARELYRTVPEGEIVPEQFFRVLIDIFINIEKVREKLAAKAAG